MNNNLNTDSKPLITVVMAFYNTEKYISEAVQSILNQTYRNFEFIIINDGSTDNSEKIVRQFKDERIIYVENDTQKGVAYCANIGFRLAKGKYIARMDSDDIAFPERFSMQVNFLEAHPNIDILGTNHYVTGEKQSHTDEFVHEKLRVVFLFYQDVLNPSVMMRVSALKEHNLQADETFVYGSDFDFFIRAQMLGLKFANLPERLMQYRRHLSQISTARRREQDAYGEKVRLNYYSFLWKEDLSQQEKIILSKLYSKPFLPLQKYTDALEKVIAINREKHQFEHATLINYCIKYIFFHIKQQPFKTAFAEIKYMLHNHLINQYASAKQKNAFIKDACIRYAKKTIKRLLRISNHP